MKTGAFGLRPGRSLDLAKLERGDEVPATIASDRELQRLTLYVRGTCTACNPCKPVFVCRAAKPCLPVVDTCLNAVSQAAHGKEVLSDACKNCPRSDMSSSFETRHGTEQIRRTFDLGPQLTTSDSEDERVPKVRHWIAAQSRKVGPRPVVASRRAAPGCQRYRFT